MLRRAFIVCSIVFWSIPAGAADDAASLQKLIEATLAAVKAGQHDKATALVKPMTLPNATAWFRKVFGDDLGAKLAAEYNTMAPDLTAGLVAVFEGRVKDGRTLVSVTKVESSADDNATGAQKQALAAMKVKLPLYSVRLREQPGTSPGYTLWSF